MQYWNSYPWIESQHVLIAPPPPPPPLLQFNYVQNTFSDFTDAFGNVDKFILDIKLGKYSMS